MKRIIDGVVFGRSTAISGAIALVVLLVLGCSCLKDLGSNSTSNSSSNSNTSTPDTASETPSNAEVERLLKDTIAEFSAGVDSGDFTTMYNNASEDFQKTYTLDEVKSAFKSYTDKKRLVLPILKKVPSIDPSFDKPPAVRTERSLNILSASGKFPTKPYNVRFDQEYVKRDGQWKLLKFKINIP